MTDVAVAILCENKRYLLCQRRAADPVFSGKWEFPGGKIEVGEDAEGALIRELKEELSVDVAIRSHFGDFCYTYDQGSVSLKIYFAKIIAGEIVLTVHQQAEWVLAEKLAEYDLLAANFTIVDELCRYEQNQNRLHVRKCF